MFDLTPEELKQVEESEDQAQQQLQLQAQTATQPAPVSSEENALVGNLQQKIGELNAVTQ